ncbi:hypothetical protein N7513_005954 [Penicillium frequentans]|nr:hypothetical protein N7513_005954 [Penicillium glabrum]
MHSEGVDELLVVQAPHDSAPNSPVVGELNLDEDSTLTSFPPSQHSSSTDLAETELHWEDEDGQETRSVRSVDQTNSSPTESQDAAPFSGRVEASSA